MAILFATQGSSLRRDTGAFLDLTGDFSIMFWTQILSVPPADSSRVFFGMINDGGTGYLVLNQPTSLATAVAYVAGNAAAASINSTSTITYMVPHVWYHLALTYVNSTNTLSLYLNGTLVTSGTLEFNATTFNLVQLGEGPTGFGNTHSNLAVSYYRAFSSALTATQLKAEMVSETAVVASPFTDTPLKVAAHLDDVSGNNRIWTVVGIIGTVTGPLLNTPFTNTTAATAIELLQLPITLVQNVRSGTTQTVWFKYTATEEDTVIGFAGFGDPTVYTPYYAVMEGFTNATAGTPYLTFGAQSTPIQVPVTAGNTYYISVTPNSSAANPAVLVLHGLRAPRLTAPVESLAINDESDGQPLVVLNNTTGLPATYINNFPAGRHAHMLPDGRLGVDGGGVLGGLGFFIYDKNLVRQFGPVTLSPTFADLSPIIISSDRGEIFYVGGVSTVGSNVRVTTVSANTGLQGATTFTLTVSTLGLAGLAIKPDRTVLYYVSGGGADLSVRRWDLVNNIALGTFAAPAANYQPIGHNCLLVLADNTVLYATKLSTSVTDSRIYHYSSTGTLLNEIALTATLNAMTHSVDDPTNVYLRLFRDLGIGVGYTEFIKINTTTAVLTRTTPNVPHFNIGTYQPVPAAGTHEEVDFIQHFGSSNSGAFWTTRAPIYGAPALQAINVPLQWRLHRLDLKPRKEERA